MKKTALILFPLLLSSVPVFASTNKSVAVEQDGFVAVEAEAFTQQTNDTIRKWIYTSKSNGAHNVADPDESHISTASGGAYIEILPDTRVTHDDPLEHGISFSDEPGKLAIVTYPITFNNPGRYWVWVSAFSTGTEDNGLHVGLNGEWPKSGQRIQWCEGKNKWTWSSAQRVEYNHCGTSQTIFIDIPSAGVHEIQFSMREDGTEIDRFIMVADRNFTPEGFETPDLETYFQTEKRNDGSIRLGFDNIEHPDRIPFYKDYNRVAYGINAGNVDHRKGFAAASTRFPGQTGTYTLKLKTLTELDGESTYRILVNNQLAGAFTNPETTVDYKPALFETDSVQLKKGDTIRVESCADSNGKIDEPGGKAWARGRWQELIAIPVSK